MGNQNAGQPPPIDVWWNWVQINWVKSVLNFTTAGTRANGLAFEAGQHKPGFLLNKAVFDETVSRLGG